MSLVATLAPVTIVASVHELQDLWRWFQRAKHILWCLEPQAPVLICLKGQFTVATRCNSKDYFRFACFAQKVELTDVRLPDSLRSIIMQQTYRLNIGQFPGSGFACRFLRSSDPNKAK